MPEIEIADMKRRLERLYERRTRTISEFERFASFTLGQLVDNGIALDEIADCIGAEGKFAEAIKNGSLKYCALGELLAGPAPPQTCSVTGCAARATRTMRGKPYCDDPLHGPQPIEHWRGGELKIENDPRRAKR